MIRFLDIDSYQSTPYSSFMKGDANSIFHWLDLQHWYKIMGIQASSVSLSEWLKVGSPFGGVHEIRKWLINRIISRKSLGLVKNPKSIYPRRS